MQCKHLRLHIIKVCNSKVLDIHETLDVNCNNIIVVH